MFSHKPYTAFSVLRACLVSVLLAFLLSCCAMAQTIEAFAGKEGVVPEGSSNTVFIKGSTLTEAVTVNLSLDPAGTAMLSNLSGQPVSSLELSAAEPSMLLVLSIDDNEEEQAGDQPFSLTLTAAAISYSQTLTFTVPPNDLAAAPTLGAVFKTSGGTEIIGSLRGELTVPGLQATKTFAVSSADVRVAARSGLITGQTPFPFSFDAAEGQVLNLGDTINLKISHLDAFARNGAQIDSGQEHACAVRSDGAIACWGSNDRNQADPPSGEFLAVSAGALHTCAVKTDNTLACWGTSRDGQINPAASNRGDVSNDKFLAVSAGGGHTCAIKTDNTLACWGQNLTGAANPTSSLQGVSQDTRFLAVSAGDVHTCAIKTDNTLACWGGHNYYSIAIGILVEVNYGQSSPTESTLEQGGPISKNTRFLAVSAGAFHTCGIKTDNTLACWGRSRNVQSIPARSRSEQGGPISKNTRFLAVGAGLQHSCGIRIDGTAACWGNDLVGNDVIFFAQPTKSQSSQGGPVSKNTRFLAVSTGDYHSCGIRIDGTAACWGAEDDILLDPITLDSKIQKAKIIPDTFWLHEKSEQAEAAVLLLPLPLMVSPPQVTIKEGESAELRLSINGTLAAPATLMLTVQGSVMINGSTMNVILRGTDPEKIITVTALLDNVIQAAEKSAVITMNTQAETIALSRSTIPITIKNNEFHTVAFTSKVLNVEEGSTGTAGLEIAPPLGPPQSQLSSITVSLVPSDAGRITVVPDEVTFMEGEAQTSKQVTITALKADSSPEASVAITIRETQPAGLEDLIKTDDDLTIVSLPPLPLMVSPPRIAIKEGESTQLRLSADSRDSMLPGPATITLTAQGSIRINGTTTHSVVLDGQTTQVTVTIMAVRDMVVQAAAKLTTITLATQARTISLPSPPAIPITIKNNEFHTVAFTSKVLNLEEGSTGTAGLEINPLLGPPQSQLSSITVSLVPSDAGRITVVPDEVTFMEGEAQTSKQVTITALKADSSPEASVAITIRETQPAGLEDLIKTDDDLTIVTTMMEAPEVRIKVKVYLEGALP